MRDHAAPAATRTHDPDYYQRDTVALAARIAERHGTDLFGFDAAELARRDSEFAAVLRREEAVAEDVLCRALDVADIHQP